MIIVRRTWAQVPDGAIVVSPATGRVMIMMRKVILADGSPGVDLSDPDDGYPDFVRTVPVNPHDPIDVVETDSSVSRAVDILSGTFSLQRM